MMFSVYNSTWLYFVHAPVRIIGSALRFSETLAACLMFVAEPVGLALIFILWRMFINFPM